MRISHRKKFIFISIPRTGSESIRKCLDPYTDIFSSNKYPYFHHVAAKRLKKHFVEMNWDWNSYFKFAFVRNPWDRIVSYYLYFKPDTNLYYSYNPEHRNKYHLIPFTKWINKLNDEKRNGSFKQFLQTYYIFDEQNNPLLDFVGRFEYLERDWTYVCKKLGFDSKLLKSNSTERVHYSVYFNKKTEKIIGEKLRGDIERFGYTSEHLPLLLNLQCRFKKSIFTMNRKKIKDFIIDEFPGLTSFLIKWKKIIFVRWRMVLSSLLIKNNKD